MYEHMYKTNKLKLTSFIVVKVEKQMTNTTHKVLEINQNQFFILPKPIFTSQRRPNFKETKRNVKLKRQPLEFSRHHLKEKQGHKYFKRKTTKIGTEK